MNLKKVRVNSRGPSQGGPLKVLKMRDGKCFLKKKVLQGGEEIENTNVAVSIPHSSISSREKSVSGGRGGFQFFPQWINFCKHMQRHSPRAVLMWWLRASNMLGLEVRFPLKHEVSSLGNQTICRDLEIMSFRGGKRCCSGSPENILSDWLVFYSLLSRPGVCC